MEGSGFGETSVSDLHIFLVIEFDPITSLGAFTNGNVWDLLLEQLFHLLLGTVFERYFYRVGVGGERGFGEGVGAFDLLGGGLVGGVGVTRLISQQFLSLDPTIQFLLFPLFPGQ